MKRIALLFAIIGLMIASQVQARWRENITVMDTSRSYKALADTFGTWHNKDLWFLHVPDASDADYTRTFQFRNNYSNAMVSGCNHSTLYSRATWLKGDNSYGFINGFESQFRSHSADEAITGTAIFGFAYIDNGTYPTAQCRTLYAGRLGIRTEADYRAENGTGLFGLDINMDAQVRAGNVDSVTNWTALRIWSASVASGLIANRGIQFYVPGTQHIQKDIELQDGHTIEDSGGVVKIDACMRADTLGSLFKIDKHAFGNSAANLQDTTVVVGLNVASVICGGDYMPDGNSSTYNAIRKRIGKKDTLYITRVATTDPDSIGAITIIR